MPNEDVTLEAKLEAHRQLTIAAGKLLGEKDILIRGLELKEAESQRRLEMADQLIGIQNREKAALEDRIELLDRAYEQLAGIRYSELERRAQRMHDHPEEMISHEEAMASLRENRPARTIREMREKSSEAETINQIQKDLEDAMGPHKNAGLVRDHHKRELHDQNFHEPESKRGENG